MRLSGKAIAFLFLFILISPLRAEEDEDPPLSEGLFFFEELFLIEESFFFDDPFPEEETLLSEEPPPGEETPLAEETLPGEEALLVEEAPPGEETLLAEETIPGEEALLVEEAPSGEETLLAEETIPGEENIPDEEIDIDDFFFFESPPLVFEVPTFEMRSLHTLFPNFSIRQRIAAMNNELLRNSFTKDESPTLIPNPELEIDLLSSAMKKSPSHLIEALMLVPYNKKELDLLDIYNALGRIEKIKEYPAYINDNALYIFTESTRIESDRRRRAIPDPLPAITLPFSERIYLCLKEYSMGNLFIRADISISMYGITYSMSNFTDVRYFLVPVVKAEKYITIIYLEPVKEGILIYSITGFYLPGFLADKINLTPNINRRIGIFIDWITDGLREQER